MNKTWFIDIDGTLVRHLENEEIDEGREEELLPYTLEFLEGIKRRGDYIILTTARMERHREMTEKMLDDFGIEYNHIIFGIGSQERIVVNDIKPINAYDGGDREKPLPTAYAINMNRNEGFSRVLDKDLWNRPLNAKEKVFDLFDLKWFYSGEMG